jgi:hypothetical protein
LAVALCVAVNQHPVKQQYQHWEEWMPKKPLVADRSLGILVANIHNMFVLCGSNPKLGHNSITFVLEPHHEFTVNALTQRHARWRRRDGLHTSRANPTRQNAASRPRQGHVGQSAAPRLA